MSDRAAPPILDYREVSVTRMQNPYLPQTNMGPAGFPIHLPPLPAKWSAPLTMAPELDVFVPGRAKTQGSKDYKGRRRNGSAILVESSDVKPWRYAVAEVCRATGARFVGPVEVALTFVCHRPQKIKDTMTGLGRSAGDGDKLTRAVWDALTDAGVIEDDSRVLRWSGSKILTEAGKQPGVRIQVRSLQ